ncbi:hypothetical protein GGR77_002095 [Xanthomonas translucens]
MELLEISRLDLFLDQRETFVIRLLGHSGCDVVGRQGKMHAKTRHGFSLKV